ncbi:hypothetical protein Bca52824_096348 [Brassica carinata]|uniref:Uncharacterized protein n=1 Tax=Brassica carinata TaxID=52824 RepID=A0A8X7P1R4_BRACI|nr:hypothetical protein Bca52824_096348 [Brassica carinata]
MGELSSIRSTITDRIPGAQRVMLTLCLESKFDSYGREPRIVLVTSVNPKIVAGKLYVNGTSATPVPEVVALGSDASNVITCNVADQATTADDSLPGRLPREKEQVPLEENAPKKARVE